MITIESQDQKWVLEFCRRLTGNQYPPDKERLLIKKVQSRIQKLGLDSFEEYLGVLDQRNEELKQLVSLATIHTTSWFREKPHFVELEKYVIENQNEFSHKPIRILSAACSSGQEVYSIAFLLEDLKLRIPHLDYEIYGYDIDRACIDVALEGHYTAQNLPHLEKWTRYINVNHSDKTFKIRADIKKKCFFKKHSLCSPLKDKTGFDWIFCRNALIYFNDKTIQEIIFNFKSILRNNSRLCLGHSEHFEHQKLGFNNLGHSIYTKSDKTIREAKKVIGPESAPTKPIHCLVVDDSKTMRKYLKDLLVSHNIKVLLAEDTVEAEKILKSEKVDILTVDLQMPGLNGDDWIRKKVKDGFKIPFIFITETSPENAHSIFEILANARGNYFEKSALAEGPQSLVSTIQGLAKSSQKAEPRRRTRSKEPLTRPDYILVGASTGGTSALIELLKGLPKPSPPVLVVQHITPAFARPFAERLASVSGLSLQDPEKSPRLKENCLYMSLGDYHMIVEPEKLGLTCKPDHSSPVMSHRPSVDKLFFSFTNMRKKKLLSILLTGMGSDGAQGLLDLKNTSNTFNICQDEESSVIFGMPKVAIEKGASHEVLSLTEIRNQMFISIENNKTQKAG